MEVKVHRKDRGSLRDFEWEIRESGLRPRVSETGRMGNLEVPQ